MNHSHIHNIQRLEASRTEATSRERAPSKRLDWAIWGKTHAQVTLDAHWRGDGCSGMQRIALRLVASGRGAHLKLMLRSTVRRNPLILSLELKLHS